MDLVGRTPMLIWEVCSVLSCTADHVPRAGGQRMMLPCSAKQQRLALWCCFPEVDLQLCYPAGQRLVLGIQRRRRSDLAAEQWHQ